MWGSELGGLDAGGLITNAYEFSRGGSECLPDPVALHQPFHHPLAEIVPSTLGNHLSTNKALAGGHAP